MGTRIIFHLPTGTNYEDYEDDIMLSVGDKIFISEFSDQRNFPQKNTKHIVTEVTLCINKGYSPFFSIDAKMIKSDNSSDDSEGIVSGICG